jgi:hypothetical protein
MEAGMKTNGREIGGAAGSFREARGQLGYMLGEATASKEKK